eukprot:PhF_6_TR25512/c1_g2_i13/m.35616
MAEFSQQSSFADETITRIEHEANDVTRRLEEELQKYRNEQSILSRAGAACLDKLGITSQAVTDLEGWLQFICQMNKELRLNANQRRELLATVGSLLRKRDDLAQELSSVTAEKQSIEAEMDATTKVLEQVSISWTSKHSQQAVHSIVQSHLSTNDVHCMQQQQWSATELEKLQDKLTELESELRDVDET